MKILQAPEYSKALSIIKDVKINTLFAQSILRGKVDGKVYVDDIINPGTFYIIHPYGMSLLFGNHENDELNKDLTAYLLNQNKIRDKFEWLQVYPDKWYSKIESLLGKKLVKEWTGLSNEESNTLEDDVNILEYKRINFIFNRERYEGLKINNLDNSFRLVKTSEDLFNQITGSVIPSNFWNNSEDFIKNSIGFSIINEKGIPVSTSFAAFIIDGKLEIGIETDKEYYGKGFASIVCCALIDYCFQNDFEPVWACSSVNAGSIKLAQKIGFDELLRIPYYRLTK